MMVTFKRFASTPGGGVGTALAASAMVVLGACASKSATTLGYQAPAGSLAGSTAAAAGTLATATGAAGTVATATGVAGTAATATGAAGTSAAAAGSSAAAAGSSAAAAGAAPSGAADTFTAVVAIFADPKVNCGQCHGVMSIGGGLMFNPKTDPQGMYTALVNKVSAGMSGSQCGGKTYVVPGQPDASLLYDKLSKATPSCGMRMPASGVVLTDDQLATVRAWIADGAKND